MLQRLKRRRGGQPGNKNAVGNKGGRPIIHGRYSARLKAARWAIRQAEAEKERAEFEQWSRPILQRCEEQHRRVMAQIEAERAERALTEPDLWPPID